MLTKLYLIITILVGLAFKNFAEDQLEIRKNLSPNGNINYPLNISEMQLVKQGLVLSTSSILCGLKSRETTTQFRQIVEVLDEQFEGADVKEILSDSIKNAEQCKDPKEILNFIYETYQDETLNSLKMLIRLLDIYFEVYVTNIISTIHARCGYVLYKIKKKSNYKKLDYESQRKVDILFKKLPESVLYVFENRPFCLMNNYYNEYIYTTSYGKINADIYRVFTWHDKFKVDPDGYIKAEIIESTTADDITDFSLNLLGTLYKVTYFTMLETSRVAARRSLPQDVYHDSWKIIFSNDDIVQMHQAEKYMCASSSMYTSQRRNVDTTRSCYPHEAAFWKLGNCSRRNQDIL